MLLYDKQTLVFPYYILPSLPPSLPTHPLTHLHPPPHFLTLIPNLIIGMDRYGKFIAYEGTNRRGKRRRDHDQEK